MTRTCPAPAWIPSRLVDDARGLRCEWIDAAGIRFTDPFFEMTVARCRHEHRRRVSSALEQLYDHAALTPRVTPVFIFHVSRCGSTLLSQLFGLDDGTVVLSEAPLLDEILRLDAPEADRLFEGALRVLADRGSPGAMRCVVKTDCWHLFHAARIRRLYPDAPFILLYRAPSAVLASQHRVRGLHMVPGLLPRAPFHTDYDPASASLDQYAARVLARHYQAMLDLATADRHSLLVSYDEGFPAAFLRTARWLGLSHDAGQLSRVWDRCGYHAKRPQEMFGQDTAPPPLDVDLAPLDALAGRLDAMRFHA